MKLLMICETGVGGVTEEWWLRPDGKITIRRVQDADPIFNANRRELNSHSAKGRVGQFDGLGRKVASIPFGLIEQYRMETGINLLCCTDAEFKRFLNDPNYSKIRTAHGRI